MTNESNIIFRRIPPGPKKPCPVAVADVPIFKGVYLRGWEIYRSGGKIQVIPPHRIVRDEETGKLKVWTYLKFREDRDFHLWIEKIRDEFERWESVQGNEYNLSMET